MNQIYLSIFVAQFISYQTQTELIFEFELFEILLYLSFKIKETFLKKKVCQNTEKNVVADDLRHI